MNTKEVVLRAKEIGKCIPAFNIPHLPMLKPIAEAIRDENSVAMIQVARVEWEKMSSESLERVAEEYAKYAVPGHTLLHLDHVPVIDEDHIEVESDTLPFDTRPWMKAAETTDRVLEKLNEYDFVRLNYAGGDMVGHFAELEPTITALEAIDIQLTRLAAEVDRLGGVLIVTADHGNAEELVDENGQPKTAHTTNLVPFVIYDNTKNREKYQLKHLEQAGLANVAATVATLLGLDHLPASWQPSLIELAGEQPELQDI